jgi:tetratricopeptide (TPR) repeat protein
MAEKPDKTTLPKVTAEQRRSAAGQYERAQQVLATGNFEYGIVLLRQCCLIDPGSMVYRQTLRQAQKNMYQDNGKGQSLSYLRGLPSRLRLQAAVGTGNFVKALEYGEEVLTRNPWEQGVLLAMAEAMEGLSLLDQALWTLDAARKTQPKSVRINRRLAQVLEKLGNFTQAAKLWDFVRRSDPGDEEAQNKAKDLAANETIARGRFQDVIDGTVETFAATGQKASAAEAAKEQEERADGQPADDSAEASDEAEERVERGARDVAAVEAKIEARPKDAANYLHLAGIHRRHDRLDKARAALEQGMVATGNYFDIAIELVDLGIEPFRRDLAITEEKLSADPADKDLRKIRSRLLKEINSRELDFFRQKSDRFPTDKGHHFEMGVRLLALNQLDEAIKELQTTRNDPRHRAKSLYYLGFCFKQRNNWRLAQRNFEEALQNLATGDVDLRKDVLFELASGLADAGDLARAFEIGCELADIDYSYKNIGTLIEQWQKREASGDG